MRTRKLAIAIPLIALTGCASVSGGRVGLADRWRTIASANGASLPSQTGPPGAEMTAELGMPESRRSASGRVSGRVIDDRGEPVANAEVRLADGGSRAGKDVRTLTDEAGGFTLRGLRAGGAYTLVAQVEDGPDLLVGRTRVEAPDTGVKIRLLDPEVAEAEPERPSPGSPSRVERVTSRDERGEWNDGEPATDEWSVRRAPRSRRNSSDLPPAEAAETLDVASEMSGPRTSRPAWRPASATADPEVEAATAQASPITDPLPPEPAPEDGPEPEAEVETKPIAAPETKPIEFPYDEEPNPLPPAMEPPVDPRPKGEASSSVREAVPVEPDRDLLPPSREDPSSIPNEPNSESVTVENKAKTGSSPEPVQRVRTLDPAANEPNSDRMPEAAPELPSMGEDALSSSVAIPVEPAGRRRPTWKELTEQQARAPAAVAVIGSTLPISTRRSPPPRDESASGSRFRGFGLLGGRATPEADSGRKVQPSLCQYDAKKQRVVDFLLPDLDGRPVRLRDFDSDFVLLDFWGTWCQPCKESIPHLVDLQSRYGPKTLRVVGIASEDHDLSAAEQSREVDAMARETGINYPLLLSGADGKSCPLQEALHIGAYPTMILLDRNGQILWRGTGASAPTLARLDRVIAARADTGIVRR